MKFRIRFKERQGHCKHYVVTYEKRNPPKNGGRMGPLHIWRKYNFERVANPPEVWRKTGPNDIFEPTSRKMRPSEYIEYGIGITRNYRIGRFKYIHIPIELLAE